MTLRDSSLQVRPLRKKTKENLGIKGYVEEKINEIRLHESREQDRKIYCTINELK